MANLRKGSNSIKRSSRTADMTGWLRLKLIGWGIAEHDADVEFALSQYAAVSPRMTTSEETSLLVLVKAYADACLSQTSTSTGSRRGRKPGPRADAEERLTRLLIDTIGQIATLGQSKLVGHIIRGKAGFTAASALLKLHIELITALVKRGPVPGAHIRRWAAGEIARLPCKSNEILTWQLVATLVHFASGRKLDLD